MKLTRRTFLVASGSAAVAATAKSPAADSALNPQARTLKPTPVTDGALEEAAAQTVLDLKGFKDPVIIESIQLLKKGREHFVRVRSKDGAEGIAVDNGRADLLHPILQQLVIPYFLGKDARDLEAHLFGVYMLHFASCVAKIGPWQEYKEGVKPYGKLFHPPLRIVEGALTVPQGPGVGLAEPKELLKDAELVNGGAM